MLVFYLFVNTHYIYVFYDTCTGSGRPTKITSGVLRLVECQMQIDDETTAIQLQKILFENGHPLSINTILRSRDRLGWTFRGSAYCQMIREQNKEKRLDWARLYLDESQSNASVHK